MADLVGVIEESRKDGDNNSGNESEKASSYWDSAKRKRSKKRRKSGGSAGSSPVSPSDDVSEGEVEEAKSAVPSILERTNRRIKGASQEDHQARFYADYRKVAEEYDKDFLGKYDEDLNTTLIFAGLFSAVASAFIIEVDSQLQPDSGDETAALLRVLIYKIDNTTFGNDVPTPPEWTGPPTALVQVQAMLFASLAVSLLSAFLAMLGKQWLNRYVSTDLRGSPIERSQRRQRKLDGIIAWYFYYVMESLPVMMQGALLLLGCALSRYLWGIDVTIAAVILTITAFGLLLFVFIVIAGAISESCPYQTPGSQILRYVAPRVWTRVRSIPSAIGSVRSAVSSTTKNTFRQSRVIETFARNVETYNPWWSRSEIIPFLRNTVLKVPLGLAIDVYRFGRATFRALTSLPSGLYHLLLRTNRWSYGAYLTVRRRLGQEEAASDLRCISWTLQTSLDKPVHLTTLEHLGTLTEFAGFDPRIVADCFNVFVVCVSFTNNKLVVLQGLEQLATASIECFFQTLYHLWSTNPGSGTLADLRRRYNRVFPFETDFRGLPFYHTIRKIHTLADKDWNPRNNQWDDYRPSDQEYTSFARGMVEAAQAEYQQGGDKKVPRWILRFALHSMSLDPPSPPSVIADSLVIVAVDLDCDVSNVTNLDESIRLERVSSLIARRLASIVEVSGMETPLRVKRKAISTLFPYALRLEQGRQREMVDIILRTARALESSLEGFMWRRIEPHFTEVCRVFPSEMDFKGLPFYHTIRKTYALIGKPWNPRNYQWDDYRPSDQEFTWFARGMVGAAQAEYQQGKDKKVPRWILRFALHSLSLDPPPPLSVIADSLVIAAIDLDCDGSNITASDEGIRVERVLSLITWRLTSIVEASGMEALLRTKCKAISTLFPYALRLEQGGQREMVDIILRAARVLESSLEGFVWRRIEPHIAEVFNESSPQSLDRAIIFASPYVPWHQGLNTPSAVIRWATAVSAVPYSEEVGQSVVNTLLRISDIVSFQPHIPSDIWAWLKRRPTLPPVSWGRSNGSLPSIVRHVRVRRDFELLKSYLLLVWSEWDHLDPSGLTEMQAIIREEFGGITMFYQRDDLVERLNQILGELDRGVEYFEQYKPQIDEAGIRRRKEQYGKLLNTVLEVDREAMEILTRSHWTFSCSLPLPLL